MRWCLQKDGSKRPTAGGQAHSANSRNAFCFSEERVCFRFMGTEFRKWPVRVFTLTVRKLLLKFLAYRLCGSLLRYTLCLISNPVSVLLAYLLFAFFFCMLPLSHCRYVQTSLNSLWNKARHNSSFIHCLIQSLGLYTYPCFTSGYPAVCGHQAGKGSPRTEVSVRSQAHPSSHSRFFLRKTNAHLDAPHLQRDFTGQGCTHSGNPELRQGLKVYCLRIPQKHRVLGPTVAQLTWVVRVAWGLSVISRWLLCTHFWEPQRGYSL
jgi:hypothetical protein